MLDIKNNNQLRDALLQTLKVYAPEAPSALLASIEEKSGVAVAMLEERKIERFISTLRTELNVLTESWKARFVSGVMRKLIMKKIRVSNYRSPDFPKF